MRRIILAILTFIFCLLWAEVKVEKMLETTSIKEYNQWVTRNKAKYPELRPIYVNAKQAGRTQDEGYKYKIYYYDENGEKKDAEEVNGLVTVDVSPYYDAVGIFWSDTTLPYANPSRSIIKNQYGEIIVDTQHVYFAFVSPYLYLTVPVGEVSPPHPSVQVFSVKNKTRVRTLKDCWLLNERDVAHSYDFNFTVASIEVDWHCNSQHLLLLDSEGNEKWRKAYYDNPEKFGGINVAIAPDATAIVAIKDEKIYVYDSSGILQKEVSLPNLDFVQCGVSNLGKFLLIVSRSYITKYDNEDNLELWRKEITEGLPIKVVLSKESDYGLIQFYPNVVYLINESGNILKRWDLEAEVHHPTAPSGRKIEVIHPVEVRLEFHKDIAVIIHELNGEIFIKIWRLKE
ncbi:MAG: hypothetical protein N3A65_09770, partial [candidate division WOR-3 bacterium]|nr:hypothetical protein [candidate division WOR-3 bacterium]